MIFTLKMINFLQIQLFFFQNDLFFLCAELTEKDSFGKRGDVILISIGMTRFSRLLIYYVSQIRCFMFDIIYIFIETNIKK